MAGATGATGAAGLNGLNGATGPTGATGAAGTAAVYFGTTTTVSGTAIATPHIVAGIVNTINGNVVVTFTGSAAFTSATSYACTITDTIQLQGSAQSVVLTQTGGSITVNSNQTGVARYICIGN